MQSGLYNQKCCQGNHTHANTRSASHDNGVFLARWTILGYPTFGPKGLMDVT